MPSNRGGFLYAGATITMFVVLNLVVPFRAKAQHAPDELSNADTILRLGHGPIIPITPADSGRTASAYMDFSRYTPAACERMIANAVGAVYRGWTSGKDPTRWNVELDDDRALPPNVERAARACAAQFTPATVPAEEIRAAVRVYAALGDEARLDETMRRWLSLSPDAFSRGRALFELLSANFDARPIRVAQMLAAASALDSLPAGADLWRVEAGFVLAQYWIKHYDLQRITQTGEAAARTYARLPAAQRGLAYAPILFTMVDVGQALLDAYGISVLDTLRRTVRATFPEAAAAQVDQMIETLVASREQIKRYGNVATPLPAAFAYDLGERTQRPAPGRAMLLYRLDPNCGDCAMQYAELKSLAARYTSGLEITLVTQTQGFLPGTEVLTPAEEGPAIRKFVRDTLGLPFGLLIEDVPFIVVDDGRKFPGKSAFTDRYGSQVVLLDRSAKIRWLGDLTSRPRVEEAVRRVVTGTDMPGAR